MLWLICIIVKLCIKINIYDNNWSLDLYDYESCKIIQINHFLIYINQINCSLNILHNKTNQKKYFWLFYLMIQANPNQLKLGHYLAWNTKLTKNIRPTPHPPPFFPNLVWWEKVSKFCLVGRGIWSFLCVVCYALFFLFPFIGQIAPSAQEIRQLKSITLSILTECSYGQFCKNMFFSPVWLRMCLSRPPA